MMEDQYVNEKKFHNRQNLFFLTGFNRTSHRGSTSRMFSNKLLCLWVRQSTRTKKENANIGFTYFQLLMRERETEREREREDTHTQHKFMSSNEHKHTSENI